MNRNLSNAQFGVHGGGHAKVHVMGGAPPEYPHAFMPVCDHPDHANDPSLEPGQFSGKTFWSGSVYRGNDTDSPGWHQAWDEAAAHDIRYHTSSDSDGGRNYDEADPFSPRQG